MSLLPLPLRSCALGLLALTFFACSGGSSGDDDGGLLSGPGIGPGAGTEGGDTSTSGGDDDDDDDDDGSTGPGAPTTMTGPGDSADDGTTTGDDGTLDCEGPVLDTLPIDSSGWIPRECTEFDIQGSWYCFDDGITETSCAGGAPPYQDNAMCLSGNALGPVDGAWGAGIGVGLNETGGAMSVKMPYDAAANGVLGFAIEVSGDTGGNALRIGFTGAAAPDGPSPFVTVPGAGSYEVMIEDALVPSSWMVPQAGDTPDPSAIYDVQIQLATDANAAPFDFCITSLTPLLEEGTGSDEQPPPYGDEVCGQFATIPLTNQYLVSNNVWNDAVYAAGGTQCISALWDGSSDIAGFVAEPSFSVGTPAPGSYPSIIYGWHYNSDVPGPYRPQTVSSISSIPSQWAWDVPNAGQYNVAYDLWLHPNPTVTQPNGGLELMIWTTTRDVQPIGSYQGYNVDVEGASWEVWYGSPGGWNTVSYRRATNVSSVDMDLLPFVEHAVSQGYAQSGWSLLGVEAGFEVWQGFDPMTTTSFHVSVQ